MNRDGWIFLGVSWGLVVFWTAWSFYKVLFSKRHWTEPREDIRELRHDEFSGVPRAPGRDMTGEHDA